MGLINNRRSVMNLLSDPLDIYCHRVRFVMAEKAVTVEVIDIDPNNKPEELLQYNPYNTIPTLVDRDLVIFDTQIICEYLDERFPHPPLMPVYPVMRAESRSLLLRIERDLYRLYNRIMSDDLDDAALAKSRLIEAFISMSPAFSEKAFFLSDEFSLLDCSLAPLLWRLPSLGIILPSQAKAVDSYAERIFSRNGFQASLSEAEYELRDE
ncbi:MAG: glutathione S-transferase N-terminal domain-containing protein [Gammaproteobacteria bacterium]|nr:glutathione S-transferase N-terminal domain-containing protein [Gammaproteobacteria bacterium]